RHRHGDRRRHRPAAGPYRLRLRPGRASRAGGGLCRHHHGTHLLLRDPVMLRAACLWALLVIWSAPQAGGFAVVPLRVELGPGRSGSLTITNTDEAKTFEVRAMSWKQQNRNDS